MATSSTLVGDTLPISDLYATCIQSLGLLVKTLSEDDCLVVNLLQIDVQKVVDEYGRVKIWGMDTKACLPARARGSLDDTLRHDAELKKLTHGILLRLAAILEQAIVIAKRKYDPAVGSDQDSISSISGDADSSIDSESGSDWDLNSSSRTESDREHNDDKSQARRMPKIRLLVRQMQDHTGSLYDLSSLLRRPTVTNKYIRSICSRKRKGKGIDLIPEDEAFAVADEKHVLEKMLQWRGLNKSVQNTSFESEPRAAIPTQDEDSPFALIPDNRWLCRRLAQANTRRREQFRYWKNHPYKPIQDVGEAMKEMKLQENRESQSQVSTVKTVDSTISQKGPPSRQSFSTAAISDVYDTKTNTRPRTIYEPTVASKRGSNTIPNPPKAEMEAGTFQCPYCGMLLECSEMQKRPSWKRHVFHDLRPYLCTYEACSNAGKLFVSRHDWIHHELQVHRRKFVCREEHCNKIYYGRDRMKTHLQQCHNLTCISAAQLDIIVDICDRPADTSGEAEETCVFCKKTMPLVSLQPHLATHMEAIALFVLPGPDEDEQGGSNASIQVGEGDEKSERDTSDEKSDASSLGFSEPRGSEQPLSLFDKLLASVEDDFSSKIKHWSVEENQHQIQPAAKQDSEPSIEQIQAQMKLTTAHPGEGNLSTTDNREISADYRRSPEPNWNDGSQHSYENWRRRNSHSGNSSQSLHFPGTGYDHGYQNAAQLDNDSAWSAQGGWADALSDTAKDYTPPTNNRPIQSYGSRGTYDTTGVPWNERNAIHPSSEFRVGRVIMIDWREPPAWVTVTRGAPHDARTFIRHRKFIITMTYTGHSLCLPIFTYGKQGCNIDGVKPASHGIVYSEGSEPQLLTNEPELGFPPIKMIPINSIGQLARESRVNYTNFSTVEHNCLVRFVGQIAADDMCIIFEAKNRLFDTN